MRKRAAGAAAVYGTILGAVLAMPICGEDGKSVLPPRPDNAALDYLLAAAEIKQPQSETDIKAIDFVEDDFQKLPPGVLKSRPDVAHLLEGEYALLNAIHAAAGKPTCRFDVAWEEGPEALMPHLPLIRNLARHAIAVAKYDELAGHPEKAAAGYADIERMSAHLAEEPMTISGLVAIAVYNLNISAVEGFISRDPPLEALEQLNDCLADAAGRPFPVDRWLLGEGESYGGWFQRHPKGFVGLGAVLSAEKEHPNEYDLFQAYHEIEERIQALARDPSVKNPPGGVLYFKSKEAVAALEAAVAEYREINQKLAALACKPYYESGEGVAALQASVEKRLEEMKAGPAKGNPLLLLFAEGRRAYLMCNFCEARLGMLRIMVAAVKHKAEKGAYPDTLEKFVDSFPAGLPKNPFTGKDFLYRLKDGLPSIECEPPETVRSAEGYRVDWSSLDLGRRRQKDAEALKAFLEKNPAK